MQFFEVLDETEVHTCTDCLLEEARGGKKRPYIFHVDRKEKGEKIPH